jgi:lysyl-tRNA synthetase class I
MTDKIAKSIFSKDDSILKELEGRDLVHIDIPCEKCDRFTRHTLSGFYVVKTHRELVYKCECGQECVWGAPKELARPSK